MNITVTKTQVHSATTDDMYKIELNVNQLELLRQLLWQIGSGNNDAFSVEKQICADNCATIINNALVANGD